MASNPHNPRAGTQAGSPDFQKKDFVEKIQAILIDPRGFFDAMPQGGGYKGPLVFALTIIAVAQIFSGAINALPTPYGWGGYAGYAIPRQIAYLIGTVIGAFFGIFLFAALMQLVLRRLGGKGTYEATFRVVAYSTAASIFSWVPFVSLLAAVYRVYLLVIGYSKVHQISRGRAFAALAAVISVFVILFLILAAALNYY